MQPSVLGGLPRLGGAYDHIVLPLCQNRFVRGREEALGLPGQHDPRLVLEQGVCAAKAGDVCHGDHGLARPGCVFLVAQGQETVRLRSAPVGKSSLSARSGPHVSEDREMIRLLPEPAASHGPRIPEQIDHIEVDVPHQAEGERDLGRFRTVDERCRPGPFGDALKKKLQGGLNRRNPHPRRTHQPLQCSRRRRDRSRGLNLKGKEALTSKAAFLQQCLVQMDAHFAVSLQIQHLRRKCARRMKASGQKWQEGGAVALTVRRQPGGMQM